MQRISELFRRGASKAFPNKVWRIVERVLATHNVSNKGNRHPVRVMVAGSNCSKAADAVADALTAELGIPVTADLIGNEYSLLEGHGDPHDEKEYQYEIIGPGYKPIYLVIGVKWQPKSDVAVFGWTMGLGPYRLGHNRRHAF